jgi:hypothetical protein
MFLREGRKERERGGEEEREEVENKRGREH